jgi:hypothetical protein
METETVAIGDLKAQSKKLSARAISLKMALHDLAEDLPTSWEKIREVAAETFEAYRALDELRKRIAAAGG